MYRFTIKGGLLVTDDVEMQSYNNVPYRVLENNQHGLIAVAVSALQYENAKRAVVSEFAVLIDKTTGGFIRTFAIVDEPPSAPYHGTYLHN